MSGIIMCIPNVKYPFSFQFIVLQIRGATFLQTRNLYPDIDHPIVNINNRRKHRQPLYNTD